MKIYPPKRYERHSYRVVYTRTRKRVEVDHLIAGIIKGCWKLGLSTRYCCQGDPLPPQVDIGSPRKHRLYMKHCAYIMFRQGCAKRFLAALNLECVCRPIPAGVSACEERFIATIEGEVWIWEPEVDVIRFPHSHIAAVQKRIEALSRA